MTEIKVGDIVCIKSDAHRKVLMTVEGDARRRRHDQSLASSTLATRPTDISCVWVDSNGNVLHDDFGLEALVKVK